MSMKPVMRVDNGNVVGSGSVDEETFDLDAEYDTLTLNALYTAPDDGFIIAELVSGGSFNLYARNKNNSNVKIAQINNSSGSTNLYTIYIPKGMRVVVGSLPSGNTVTFRKFV